MLAGGELQKSTTNLHNGLIKKNILISNKKFIGTNIIKHKTN